MDVGSDMNSMFMDSKFRQDISNWNVSNVTKHGNMFMNCPLENKLEFQPKFKD